jgi:membrane protease YdiL (CAAX protease family)
MTTNFDFEDEDREDSPIEAALEPAPHVTPPRVWTVFVAFLLALVAVFAVQIVISTGLVVWQLVNGANLERLTEDLKELITEPAIFIGLLLASQLVIGTAAVLPALLSPEPTLSRLGLTTPALPIWGYPIIVLGSAIPAAVGWALYYALTLLMTADPTFEIFYQKVTWTMAGPVVLFIALAPGFLEEMFFRGYIQRRLLQRWSPWAAILVSSALFALVHLAPHTVLFAFPLGIWLGVVAWRTGSIWLCIACHAFVNAIASGFDIGAYLGAWPETPPIAAGIPAGVVAILCFIVSVWLLTRPRTGLAAVEIAPSKM